MSLRNWIKTAAVIVVATTVTACGFKPIAATNDSSTIAQRPALADLKVESGDPRFTYHFRRRVLQSVDIGVPGKPSLVTNTSIQRIGLAISSDDSITRLTLRTTTKYRLKGLSDSELTSGTAHSATSLNATASQFTTEVSQRDAIKRVAEDTADRMVNTIRLYTSQ